MPKLEQFALILFTLRDQCKSREDILKSLDRIQKIGYRSIQVSGVDPTLLTEEEWVKETNARGLSICATHEPGDMIRQNPQAVIERLKKLGAKYTAYPFPADVDMANPDDVDALINDLDLAGKQLAEAGLTLCYHNHSHEFYRRDGKTVLDAIYDRTDPKHLQGELDTHWVQAGGGSNLKWIEKLNGRLPLLHLKDYRINAKNEREFAEIGHGNMDFPAIVKAAEEAGCQHFIVEQDRCPGDPFDSIEMSFKYIAEHLVS